MRPQLSSTARMARSRSPFVAVTPPINRACACFAVNQFTRRTAIGQFFTALMITLFVVVAEVLEGLTVGRGRKAIRDLLEFHPREVSVRRSGEIRAVSAEELRVSDAVLVAPGGRIPIDGRCCRVTPSWLNPA